MGRCRIAASGVPQTHSFKARKSAANVGLGALRALQCLSARIAPALFASNASSHPPGRYI